MPKDEFVNEDPMELVGMVLPGDARQMELMAETIVEEYIRLGWSEKRLRTLFTNPMYMATHRIYQTKGDDYVREMIGRMLEKWTPKIMRSV